MNVLSLFDGMSCGRIALERAGINVANYFASEIDKYAIKVSKANWTDVTQVGSVTDISYKDGMLITSNGSYKVDIDLVIGGSPCQSFSTLGNGSGFDGKSGLFYEYLRLLHEVKPKNFLLENVRMKKEWKDLISKELGVEPIEINSNLVSAQNRARLYWTNIACVTQPKDRGIYLEDILLKEVPDRLFHSLRARKLMSSEMGNGKIRWELGTHSDTDNGKSCCVLSSIHKGVPNNVIIDRRGNRCHRFECDFQPVYQHNAETGYDFCNSCTHGDNYQEGYSINSTIRKLDCVEVERLQTVPDNYTNHVADTQRYKMLGNGWTVDVIAHILKGLKHELS